MFDKWLAVATCGLGKLQKTGDVNFVRTCREKSSEDRTKWSDADSGNNGWFVA